MNAETSPTEPLITFAELWMLERVDVRDAGIPVMPYDGNPGSDDQGMLVYFSHESAESAATHQWDHYEVRCEPRRITAEPIDQPENH